MKVAPLSAGEEQSTLVAPPGGSSGGEATEKMRSGGGACVRCSNKLAAKIQRTDLVAFLWLLAGIVFAVCAAVGPGQGDIIGADVAVYVLSALCVAVGVLHAFIAPLITGKFEPGITVRADNTTDSTHTASVRMFAGFVGYIGIVNVWLCRDKHDHEFAYRASASLCAALCIHYAPLFKYFGVRHIYSGFMCLFEGNNPHIAGSFVGIGGVFIAAMF
jgi:hypothetical protein